MANPAKIFISSAYEAGLRTLRTNLQHTLAEAGHKAFLFEKGDFAPWDRNTLQTCITKVKECGIFVLLISRKFGIFLKEQKTTPTYIEFHTAVQEGKFILPFVDVNIHTLYMDFMRELIHEKMKTYFDEHDRYPDYTIDIVTEVVETFPFKSKIADVDPFIWSFLYDVEREWTWLYAIDIAESEKFYRDIKHYLSAFLSESIHFLPVAHEIRENALLAEEFDRFQSFTMAAVRLLKDGMISDWAAFLEKLIPNLAGGEVLQRPGTLLESTLVKYEPCNSVSVYRYCDGLMQLVEYSGRITPPEFYAMEEESSFVVTAYKNDVQDVRYNEDKQTLYYTLKSGEFVVCFHFRLQEKWTQANVASFRNEFYHAIITSNASLYFDFVAELLGGLKNESKSNIQQ